MHIVHKRIDVKLVVDLLFSLFVFKELQLHSEKLPARYADLLSQSARNLVS